MEPILIENLVAVATLDKAVLFVREQDVENEQALGLLVLCDNSMSWGVGLVQKILKFWSLDPLDKVNLLAEYYQGRIGKTFEGEAIYQMMTEYSNQMQNWESLENKFEFETVPIVQYSKKQENENE